MKKRIAILMTMAMLSAPFSAFAGTPLEDAILKVKQRVEIPQEMSVLDSQTYTGEEETIYTLHWTTEDNRKSLSVRADASGHILEFSQYDEAWYQNESRIRMRDGLYEEAEALADAFLHQIVPDLFANSSDCLKLSAEQESLSLRSDVFRFRYQRIRDGLRVDSNEASVSVRLADGKPVVSDVYIDWDYDAEFDSPTATLSESAEVLYQKQFPLEAGYRRYDKEQVFLEYTTGYEWFLDAKTGEKATRKAVTYSGVYKNAAMTEEAVMMDSVAGGGLREFEQKEVDAVSGLLGAEELVKRLKQMPELGIGTDNRLKTQNLYKVEEDVYQIRLQLEKDENNRHTATMDAKNGELLSFYSTNYHPMPIREKSEAEKKQEDAKSREKADAFLERYYGEKLSKSKKEENEEGTGVTYIRQIDGFAYPGNNLYASWNAESGALQNLQISWDRDISGFPKAELAVGEDSAYQAVFSRYPLELFYLETDDGYRTVYAPEKNNVRVNAISGKIMQYNGQEESEKSDGTYRDMSGHWMSEKLEKLAKYGITLTEEADFLPDEVVTQETYFRVLSKVAYPYYNFENTDALYRNLIASGVLSEAEKNPDEIVTKEKAIVFLLRTMGMRETAELQGIYLCGFADDAQISPEFYGYCALAKGFGIVRGDGDNLYPKKEMTRAEVMSVIYQYLNR